MGIGDDMVDQSSSNDDDETNEMNGAMIAP